VSTPTHTLVEAAEHLLAREPAPRGEALGEVLRRDGAELLLGVHASAARLSCSPKL
jgi:hypothetical protein